MFFSVKTPMRIAGKTYIPCICYEVTKVLELTVNKLESEGKAVTYRERVFFQNGKVIEKKPVVKKSLIPEKKDKKTKKAKAEEAVTVTEATVKDEAEGF